MATPDGREPGEDARDLEDLRRARAINTGFITLEAYRARRKTPRFVRPTTPVAWAFAINWLAVSGTTLWAWRAAGFAVGLLFLLAYLLLTLALESVTEFAALALERLELLERHRRWAGRALVALELLEAAVTLALPWVLAAKLASML